MGLLDDAIREHLELKRQRGADPGEVAREQREALDTPAVQAPVEDAAFAAAAASAAPLVDPPAVAPPPTPSTSDRMIEQAQRGAGSHAESGHAPDPTVAGETAELDMSSVLGADNDAAAQQGAPDLSAAQGDADPAQEDSLEWEMPGEVSAEGEPEQADDVLEETPDFLRDTPEQERLWFEQRPPRDFDFDK